MGHTVSRRFREGSITIRRPIPSARTRGRHLEFDRLTPPVRLVIGLHQSAGMAPGRIAEVLGASERWFEKLWRALLLDPFTATLIHDGMPGIYGESLPGSVSAIRCVRCKRLLSRVPCLNCWPDCGQVDDEEDDRYEDDLPSVCLAERTNIPAGKYRIEVMADRVARGFSPFCPYDIKDCDASDSRVVIELESEPEVVGEEILFDSFLMEMVNRA